MKKYTVVVTAYQEVEVEAENKEDACNKALDIGIDTSCAEWKCTNVCCENEDGSWEKIY